MMDRNTLRETWLREEAIAHIKGWDFSHLDGRYEEDTDFGWDYREVIKRHLTDDMRLLDCDTGGGEFLLSLGHPHQNTAATEGYPPNVELCKRTLLPLGIDFKPCSDASHLPYPDGSFDMVINRHGDFDAAELYRLLKPGGMFVTQQVGEDNDRELVKAVLPDAKKPFPHMNLTEQKAVFEAAGFEITECGESFRPIRFYDVGAFVWFARVIEWEFPGFSVDRCLDKLMELQRLIDNGGVIEGTVHRYLIAARKPK